MKQTNYDNGYLDWQRAIRAKDHLKSYAIVPEFEQLDLDKDEYLSKFTQLINERLTEFKHLLLNAPPGTGKTSMVREMAKALKKKPGKNRIVFCSPFLIIQNQFVQNMEKNGIQVDFVLNGDANKTIIENNLRHYNGEVVADFNPSKHGTSPIRVISSTFKSFTKIAKHLNEEDIVVIDEAHAIYNSYINERNNTTKQYKRSYDEVFLSNLMICRSNLLFMTGTPRKGLKLLFDLYELRVMKDLTKTPIRLLKYPSKTDNISLVTDFVGQWLKEDSSKVYVVYLKNKKDCAALKVELEKKIKRCRVAVLTSEEKNTEEVRQLSKEEKLSEEFNVLLCTNFISTGTNIHNENMGETLMVNEYDPDEILQFSKRFRSKPNIPVHVVNQHIETDDIKEEKHYEAEVSEYYAPQFKWNLVKSLNSHFTSMEDFKLTDEKVEKQDSSIKDTVINAITRHYLIQEVIIRHIYCNRYRDLSRLGEKLMQSSLLEVKSNLSEISTPNRVDKKNYEAYASKQSIKRIKFIQQHQDIFFHLYDLYTSNSTEYEISRSNFNEVFKGFMPKNCQVKEKLMKEFDNLFNGIKVYKQFINPLIRTFSKVKDLKLSLFLVNHDESEFWNQVTLQIAFNQYFHNNFGIEENEIKGEIKLIYRGESNTKEISSYDKVMTQLITLTFDYCIKHDITQVREFINHVEKGFKPIKLKQFDYPINELNVDRSSFKPRLNKNLANALLGSIFILKKEATTRKRKTGIPFADNYPPNIKSSKIYNDYYRDMKNSTGGKYVILPENKRKNKKELPYRTRLKHTRESIIYSALDDSFKDIFI